jgi:L-rhamnose mutarotase
MEAEISNVLARTRHLWFKKAHKHLFPELVQLLQVQNIRSYP